MREMKRVGWGENERVQRTELKAQTRVAERKVVKMRVEQRRKIADGRRRAWRDQNRGGERRRKYWSKGKKITGERILHADTELLLIRLSMVFFSSVFHSSLLCPLPLIVFLLRIPPPALLSLSSVYFSLLTLQSLSSAASL